jgi:1,2-diacylglycerol 3-alpha-glucosyltransferase
VKVLITTPTFPPFNSGLGNAAMRQVLALISEGVEVVVATGGTSRNTREEANGWRVEEFNVSGSDSLVNPIRGDAGSYRDFLLRSNFDVVLMNAWQTWSTDVCLRHLSDIPGKKILYSHCVSTNVFFWDRPFKSLARYLLWRPYFFRLKKILRRLDALIALAASGCDSRFDDVKIARVLGIPIFVVPNAVSEEAMSVLDKNAMGGERRTQIISVGSYDWLKGHDFVLRAYAMSAAKNVIPLKFFGQEFTPYVKKLKRMAAKLGIAEPFLYFQESVSGNELLEEYKKSILFVSGSRTECQPLVLLDTMATGTPFVSRASGCIDSLPGGYAICNELSAAASMNSLLRDKVEWNVRSAAGVAAIRAHHQPNAVGRELSAVLFKVLKQPKHI